jgi:hypothetical protein
MFASRTRGMNLIGLPGERLEIHPPSITTVPVKYYQRRAVRGPILHPNTTRRRYRRSPAAVV